MQSEKNYKTLFTIAAAWNWSVAALFLFMALFSQNLLGLFVNIIPENFVWYYLFISLVAVYGLGYYWVGQDVPRNRNIIKMGIWGKTLVFILLTIAWLTDVMTILTAGAGAVDMVFAVLFLRVLLKTKRL